MTQDLHIKHVNFRYSQTSPQVLSSLNLDIKHGEMTAFVGQTGSGKSTLMKLLLRFYHPSSGQILIGDSDISDIKIRHLRNNIGLVSQDIFLFDGSIKDNIAYGQENCSDDMIHKAAKLAEAHEFIDKLPEGYNSLIGERGVKLSGGQRQRLSLARALLKNPPILILDEATSAVDNETELAIQKSIKSLAKDRTLLVIAHRLSTIVSAGQIHVLDQGSIVESGNHASLLAQQGHYQKLWHIQTGQFSEPETTSD